MQGLVKVEMCRRRARLSVTHPLKTAFNIKEANLQICDRVPPYSPC